jgi:hypothetical protein
MYFSLKIFFLPFWFFVFKTKALTNNKKYLKLLHQNIFFKPKVKVTPPKYISLTMYLLFFGLKSVPT